MAVIVFSIKNKMSQAAIQKSSSMKTDHCKILDWKIAAPFYTMVKTEH